MAEELSVDGLLLRYRTEETDDRLAGAEGTFTICSFWLVSALVEIGEVARAWQLCEKLLFHASPLALIYAVIHVIRAEDPRATLRFVPPREPQP